MSCCVLHGGRQTTCCKEAGCPGHTLASAVVHLLDVSARRKFDVKLVKEVKEIAERGKNVASGNDGVAGSEVLGDAESVP